MFSQPTLSWIYRQVPCGPRTPSLCLASPLMPSQPTLNLPAYNARAAPTHSSRWPSELTIKPPPQDERGRGEIEENTPEKEKFALRSLTVMEQMSPFIYRVTSGAETIPKVVRNAPLFLILALNSLELSTQIFFQHYLQHPRIFYSRKTLESPKDPRRHPREM